MNETAPLVALIEDDQGIRREMQNTLERWKFRTRALENFADPLRELAGLRPDLLVLDINLPYEDGFRLCSRLREGSRIPVLVVSARSSSMDMVMALAQGADDYLAKPFDSQIFIAKVQALLRRSYEYSATETEDLRCGNYVLRRSEGSIRRGERQEVLTRNEFLVAQTLMRRPRVLVSREELMQALWRDEVFVDDNTLSVNVSRLRKKLEALGGGDPIETHKGLGYRFAAE